jgi:hypothetical protein
MTTGGAGPRIPAGMVRRPLGGGGPPCGGDASSKRRTNERATYEATLVHVSIPQQLVSEAPAIPRELVGHITKTMASDLLFIRGQLPCQMQQILASAKQLVENVSGRADSRTTMSERKFIAYVAQTELAQAHMVRVLTECRVMAVCLVLGITPSHPKEVYWLDWERGSELSDEMISAKDLRSVWGKCWRDLMTVSRPPVWDTPLQKCKLFVMMQVAAAETLPEVRLLSHALIAIVRTRFAIAHTLITSVRTVNIRHTSVDRVSRPRLSHASCRESVYTRHFVLTCREYALPSFFSALPPKSRIRRTSGRSPHRRAPPSWDSSWLRLQSMARRYRALRLCCGMTATRGLLHVHHSASGAPKVKVHR